MNEDKDVLRRGDKAYEWDDTIGGWVRAYHLDQHSFSREEVKVKKVKEISPENHNYRIVHTTPNRAQRRAAAATTRGRHYNPDIGKVVPGRRTLAKQVAKEKMRNHRNFLQAVRQEKRKHGTDEATG